jgi:uncharacterized lipoprotein YajG
MRKITIAIFAALAAVLVLAGCSRPFTVETREEQVQFSSVGGDYKEKTVDIPDKAQQADLDFKEVKVNYELTGDALPKKINVKIYVSEDTDTDGQLGDTDEQVVSVDVPTNDIVTGSETSETLKTVLNNQQKSFVIGAKVGENLVDSATITLTVNGEITAEANLGL